MINGIRSLCDSGMASFHSLIICTDLQERLATDWAVRGSNPGGARDFLHLSRPALGPSQPPMQWVPDLYRGEMRPGRGVDHPPHLAPRLK